MILGIAATTIKTIIVRLDFFDDNVDEAIKSVDLKVGSIYDITYECKHKETIYECIAKVVRIEECDNNSGHNKLDFHNTKKEFVRENIGMCNSVYTKDNFMRSNPVKKIRLIVDTSEDYSGKYEVIMIDSIRNCKLISDESDKTTINNFDEMDDIDINAKCF